MKYKIQRGVRGEAGWYRFEFDFPKYEFGVTHLVGKRFEEWAKAAYDAVESRLRDDMRKYGGVTNFDDYILAANWWLLGIGTREINKRGDPIWHEGERWPVYGDRYVAWRVSQEQAVDAIFSFGNNEYAVRKLLHRKEKSEPIYYKMEQLIIYVYTVPLDDMPAVGRAYFERAEELYRDRVQEKRDETVRVKKQEKESKKERRTQQRAERARMAASEIVKEVVQKKKETTTKEQIRRKISDGVKAYWQKLKADPAAFAKAMAKRRRKSKANKRNKRKKR